ncbi:MAG: elongation factor Ts [Chloroflexi bacterium]|nr:elongation factor Ts [Chloroflexota bacterium]
MDCRRALEAAEGNPDKAAAILRQQGMDKAEKRSQRVTSQGIVEVYQHLGGRLGAMVELNCETDFVARTDQFRDLAHNLVMQVAAMNPKYVAPEDLPADDQDNAAEACLLAQPYIRDPGRTVKDIVAEVAARTGENVKVKRFARFEVGSDQ